MESLPEHARQPGAVSGDASMRSSESEMMQALGITYLDGHYSIGGYRYGLLSEAVHYATLKAQRIAS